MLLLIIREGISIFSLAEAIVFSCVKILISSHGTGYGLILVDV
jgi:hypothetical protein